MENETEIFITEFILIGLSQQRKTQIFIFVIFLFMYVITTLGNLILICMVVVSPRMHTPMYFFLCQLSFLDLCYSSCSIPKMLHDMFSAGGGRISVFGCMFQSSTGLFLGQTECILLAVMAYDRYVAICFPLRYTIIMTWRMCQNITVVVWVGSLLMLTLPTVSQRHVFCRGNKVDHFACEAIALLKLVCGDTSIDEAMLFFGGLVYLLTPFSLILLSYLCIISSILKIHSVDGRAKAFSTCASHLTVVLMFYGTSMSLYLGPTKNVPGKQKFVSIIYGVVTPMLNPIIYSLRNNDVKVTIRNLYLKSQ
ncbi:olfactory receptor 13H1-like [Spea bombifrons]|uniref:olfactory receptor 13H1-like n=1 Tax=Spea bombifrons TaxID=233779 RepID=UPI00234BC3A5|nr:olfactory receptor 13H1-like [Spea bombifrons]